MVDNGGYWDDDLWAREDDPIAAELWANPDLPRKLLYWSGAPEHLTLEELASAWLSELADVGLPGPNPDTETSPKQAGSRRPELDPHQDKLLPVPVGSSRQLLWLNTDGPPTYNGYKSVEVLDKPLRTQTAIISLLTVLEANPIDLDGLEENLSQDDSSLSCTLQSFELRYVLHLLRYYRPSFDELTRQDKLNLIEETCKRVNTFLKASRQLVQFLDFGVPGSDLRPAIENANRDVKAAVLKDVEGLKSRQIAERLGLSSDKYKIKGGNRTVDKMIERGRELLESALGEDGWHERVKVMKEDAEWFRNLSAEQRGLYLRLDRDRLSDAEARRHIEKLGPEANLGIDDER
jgi:hypothetical protein